MVTIKFEISDNDAMVCRGYLKERYGRKGLNRIAKKLLWQEVAELARLELEEIKQ